MAKIDNTATSICSGATRVRLPYSPPRLSEYGMVRNLTTTGSGPLSEALDGMSGMCMADLTRMACVTSDVRTKENVQCIGRHPLGFGLYLFDYRPQFKTFGAGRQFGVIADEVELIVPQAVIRGDDGYKRVNYALLGIEQSTH